MKKIGFLSLILILVFCFNAYALENVNVQIPTFEITINDEVFDNQNALYPFIMYNDVTYAPLTYNLCRRLGVITGWDNARGLYLARYTEDYFQYKPDLGGRYKKGATYTASIPSFPVVLNGVNINSKSTNNLYPVLVFKNVTYLPLTWDYVYYEFGWDISWDNIRGLKINSQNSYTSGTYLYLSEMNDKFVMLQNNKDLYTEVKNEDGSITYVNTGKDEIKEYKLDLDTNTLTYEGLKGKPTYFNENHSEKVEDGIFSIEDNSLLFNGQIVEDLSNIEMKNPSLYADKWTIGETKFYQVCVFTTDEIPAPYTPFKQFVYQETDGNIARVNNWDTNNYLDSVYKIGENYYLCSNGRHIVGRWSNSLSTVLKISTDGKTTVINDKYKDYLSMKAIGVKDNKLVLKATWFGEPSMIDSKEKISAINDGYFYLDENDSLTKIYPYIEGNTFLAPNGHLYLISSSRILIIDMTTGERIKLK